MIDSSALLLNSRLLNSRLLNSRLHNSRLHNSRLRPSLTIGPHDVAGRNWTETERDLARPSIKGLSDPKRSLVSYGKHLHHPCLDSPWSWRVLSPFLVVQTSRPQIGLGHRPWSWENRKDSMPWRVYVATSTPAPSAIYSTSQTSCQLPQT